MDLIPFLGSFINSHEIKIGLPTFAPFFHHFFKTKYFFQKLKALERDKVCFSFLLFFSKFVGDYTVLLSSCIPKKSCTKSVIFFLYYYHCFLDSKMRFHFTFFIYLFFLLSIYPLAKWYVIHSFHLLNCDAIGWIFLYNYCWEE